MSLIGSLEDLSLGDILQIISLSRKSGVLVLRAESGDGRIVFREGLVCGAALKDGPADLRGVLVGGGFVPEADFQAAEIAASGANCDLEEALCEAGCITGERLDSLRRAAIEAAVVEMFRWSVGDFSFDLRETPEPDDPQLLLAVGISAQYLAMEGARCDDEGDRDPARNELEGSIEVDPDEMSAHEMFGVESEPEPVRAAVEVLAGAAIEAHAPLAELESGDGPAVADELEHEDAAVERSIEPESPVARSKPAAEETQRSEPMPSTGAGFDASRPVIAIDSDLPALEWTKAALAEQCDRVHIFQRPDLGLTRIRQYLARAVAPVVLLSPATPGDRLSGIADATDFVRRLKQQAPQIRMVWLQEDGAQAIDGPAPADAIAMRPASHQLRNGTAAKASGALEQALRDLVANIGSAAASGEDNNLPGDVLEELREMTSRLRAASTRGEVLPLVIDYAAQSFRRVAMLMIREGVAVGIAQHRLSVCGGPDDDELRRVEIPIDGSQWLTQVVAERAPVRAAPRGEGDLRLAAALGDRPASVAYLAPIECAGSVVAIIYGDDLPGGGEPRETRALEVVLHHAGLALDRAGLEHALAAASDSPSDRG